MKHYIITRFASWLSPYSGMTLDELFSDEYLHDSFVKLQNALISTLENQTNKNFELIITIHDNIPLEKVNFLNNISTHFKIHILRSSDIMTFIQNDTKNEDVVIFSRVDIDDYILNSVIDDIHNIVNECNDDYVLLGLYDGATFTKDDNIVCTHHFNYGKNGASSIMITVACKNKTHQEYLNSCNKSPVNYDHTQMFNQIINKINLKYTYSIHFLKNSLTPLYLWTCWGNNGTILTKQKLNKDINWHTTNTVLHIDFKKYSKYDIFS